MNDALNELNIEEITSDIFKTYGNDIAPLSNLLITLQNLKFYIGKIVMMIYHC